MEWPNYMEFSYGAANTKLPLDPLYCGQHNSILTDKSDVQLHGLFAHVNIPKLHLRPHLSLISTTPLKSDAPISLKQLATSEHQEEL